MIRKEIMLPKLKLGDIVVAKLIGAYTYCLATRFNSIPIIKAVVVDSQAK